MSQPSVQSVERALQICLTFKGQTALTLSEISHRVELTPTALAGDLDRQSFCSAGDPQFVDQRVDTISNPTIVSES